MGDDDIDPVGCIVALLLLVIGFLVGMTLPDLLAVLA
jgi:hypothetical protein